VVNNVRKMVAYASFARIAPPSAQAVLAVLALVILAVPAVATLFAARYASAADTPRAKHLRYARTMLVLWTITGLALYALALHRMSPHDVGVRPPYRPSAYLIGALLSLGRIALGAVGRGGVADDYARAIRTVIPVSLADWLWFVPVAATAALCEEFLYRGYALTQIAALTGSLIAGALVSSLAFGIAHAYQGKAGMLASGVTGLLYAALFVYGGSLWPCIAAHFVQDIGGAALLARHVDAGRAR